VSTNHAVLPRRGFFGRLLAASTAILIPAGVRAQEETGSRSGAAPPEEAWLELLTGRHKQIFDAPNLQNGKPLMQARNFLDAYGDAYHLVDREVSAAVVAHGNALPLLFQSQAWECFQLGEQYRIQDPQTGQAAVRNVFQRGGSDGPVPPEASVEALQRRGVVFLLCNNTLKRASAEIGGRMGRSAEDLRSALLASLLPGVHVVPAAVVAINRAQESGMTYVYAG
jgi:intracellular sulfur oxidation DsrE/DsrF family protein